MPVHCFLSHVFLQRADFDKRHAALRSYVCGSKYAKQVDSLRIDFEKFLAVRSVCPLRSATSSSLSIASPLDVLRFLHFRSLKGRTQVHVFACPHFGMSGLHDCGCPCMFAAATVDSYVGMLRSIFNNAGRRLVDNPCDSSDVKEWVKACALEQQRHHVPVKQALPTFTTHLRLLVKEIMFSRMEISSHGSRASAAITLLMLGASKEAIMEHCRWATAEVCRHYTKLERVRRLDLSACVLQTGVGVPGGVSDSDSAAHLYELLNSGLLQTPAL